MAPDPIYDTPDGLPRLLAVMARLRDPVGGCAWDREQDFASIAPYTVEEAYEVADAIARGDMDDLRGELGDLLLQVVYHAQIAAEDGAFGFDDVARGIAAKMIARHQHVFADGDAPPGFWEAGKRAERAARGHTGTLDGVALALPAMVRALKLQKRAARVGFDWDDAGDVIAKIAEEARELAEARAQGPAAVADELGDLLFAVTNLARHLGVDPEAALAGTNAKFVRRFEWVEAALRARGRTPEDSDLAEMDALWTAAKSAERGRV